MQSRLLKKMCCPFDKGDLNISIFKQEEEEIIEGLLTCSACQRYFPIIYGIPIMTPDEYRQKSLEAPVMKKWGLELPAGDQSFRLDGPTHARALEMGGDE
ncbi:Trm112 family protein [Marivirga salinae]|uniref:Trm112 family protein n=1 Tax=Marivirga salinarum TaxID=3059078 RepID=A0AA49GC15_9BACT|nr:Trm112 family protein [Marivirga sp. BDSF4-3]WKK76722.1 Trm112 family protein [Marivirga sp. BDSF4-3]